LVDDVEEMNSLEFMGENVPPRLVALQRSTQYFKEVIKECIIGGTYISYLGIDV
jgi:hypothetical protein